MNNMFGHDRFADLLVHDEVQKKEGERTQRKLLLRNVGTHICALCSFATGVCEALPTTATGPNFRKFSVLDEQGAWCGKRGFRGHAMLLRCADLVLSCSLCRSA